MMGDHSETNYDYKPRKSRIKNTIKSKEITIEKNQR